MRKRNVRFDPATVARRVEETRGLALHMAAKYARRWPRIVLEDLSQELFATLVRSAQLYKRRKNGAPFPAFALLCLKQKCWDFTRRYGWPRPEVSLDESIGERDDEPFTWGDVIDNRRAARELCTERGEVRRLKAVADLRELIEEVETLTPFERRVLGLRARGFEEPEIQKIVGRSHPTVSTAAAAGIRKVREQIASRSRVVGVGAN